MKLIAPYTSTSYHTSVRPNTRHRHYNEFHQNFLTPRSWDLPGARLTCALPKPRPHTPPHSTSSNNSQRAALQHHDYSRRGNMQTTRRTRLHTRWVESLLASLHCSFPTLVWTQRKFPSTSRAAVTEGNTTWKPISKTAPKVQTAPKVCGRKNANKNFPQT